MAGSLIISGIIQGCIYAIVGVGLVVTYKASRVVNFAQGGVAVLLTYIAYEAISSGVNYVLAVFFSLMAAVVLGLVLEQGPVHLLRNRHVLTALIGTYGFGLICEGVASLAWGTGVLSFPSPSDATVARFSGTFISADDVIIAIVTLALIVAITLFFQYTTFGISMRAVSEDRSAAELVGISVRKVSIVSWVLAAILAAVSGILVSPSLNLTPDQLNLVMISSFGAVILGGFTSVGGVVAGGIGLGVAESLFQAYVSSSLPNTFVFAIVLVVLMIRPNGLFGAREPVDAGAVQFEL